MMHHIIHDRERMNSYPSRTDHADIVKLALDHNWMVSLVSQTFIIIFSESQTREQYVKVPEFLFSIAYWSPHVQRKYELL